MRFWRLRRGDTGRGSMHSHIFCLIIAIAFLTAPFSAAKAANDPEKAALLQALKKMPANVDASPPPNFSGEFVSLGAEGTWRTPPNAQALLYNSASTIGEQKRDCSPEAIIYFAERAPNAFKADKGGSLYGVKTHTSATRVTTRYWNMPGFNSCALVVYAILKKAGCRWARHTANAKAIYDMAHKNGWLPSKKQKGGCMVAWNSRWEGGRARIGTRQKQSEPGRTLFRHVGIATGSWLAVDNSSWLSRPRKYFTYRPIVYESPIFLCPPEIGEGKEARRTSRER